MRVYVSLEEISEMKNREKIKAVRPFVPPTV